MYDQQVRLEEEMITRGRDRYIKAIVDAKSRGDASTTPIVKHSLRHLTDTLTDVLVTTLAQKRTRGFAVSVLRANGNLRKLDPAAAVWIALSTVVNRVYIKQYSKRPDTVQSLSILIGKNLEEEIRFNRFDDGYSEYYDALRNDWKRRNVRSHDHKIRVLVNRANEIGDGWVPWGVREKFEIGSYMLGMILKNSDIIEQTSIFNGNKKRLKGIILSEFGRVWIESEEHRMALLSPVTLPLVIPPRDWTSMHDGGYHTPRAASHFTFVKKSYKSDFKEVTKIINSGQANQLMDAVNILQRKPWVVNSTVLRVMEYVYEKGLGIGIPRNEPVYMPPCPVQAGAVKGDLSEEQLLAFNEWKIVMRECYSEETKRVSHNIAFSRALLMAKQFENTDELYFLYNVCFRGRLYVNCDGLNPQGDDCAKGVIQNKRSKELTARGWYWLRVHVANLFGMDKESMDDREQWTIDNHDMLVALGSDPIANCDLLKLADKPWQALNAVLDYYNAQSTNMSWSSIAKDGSCNGLQHYSALFRDSVGAASVNLIHSVKPCDVYTDVLLVLRDAIADQPTCDEAVTWQALCNEGMCDRKLTKRSVMTLPYGVMEMTVGDHITAWLIKNNIGDMKYRSKLSQWLRPILWKSIGEVVVAARAGMDWFQAVARDLSKQNKRIHVTTHIGFPIIQDIRKPERECRVRTQFFGKLALVSDSDVMDSRKQSQGVAPNITHGNDATHLAMTITLDPTLDYWVVHDSYGTHASDTDKLDANIRIAFEELYTHFTVDDLVQQFGTDIPPPPIGDYDLSSIHDSLYFFG
jgi:DNA-directed RNA polymerase